MQNQDAFELFVEENEGIFQFYGVDNNEFKLNGVVWEAIEDPDDGYRSYLNNIERKESKGIFFHEPIAIVRVIPVDSGDTFGYTLVDVFTGHVWLEIGTEYYDEYYPQFVFQYVPDPDLRVEGPQ